MVLSFKNILIFFIGLISFLLIIWVGIRVNVDTNHVISYPTVQIQVSDSLTANQIIEKSRLGSIRREFPEKLLEKTIEELEKLAQQSKDSELARKATKSPQTFKRWTISKTINFII